ncbi:hypothetical protein [Streptomyces lavendulocolor]|uniref:hypothetical protein n=1 Tax=Streptomyces lavendulocolor TaxID=67316 RepID=UPI0033E9BED8
MPAELLLRAKPQLEDQVLTPGEAASSKLDSQLETSILFRLACRQGQLTASSCSKLRGRGSTGTLKVGGCLLELIEQALYLRSFALR